VPHKPPKKYTARICVRYVGTMREEIDKIRAELQRATGQTWMAAAAVRWAIEDAASRIATTPAR
jgi:hypothetical protein